MNSSQRDQGCLKYEIFEDQFSLYGPSIQILLFNSGNFLFSFLGYWVCERCSFNSTAFILFPGEMELMQSLGPGSCPSARFTWQSLCSFLAKTKPNVTEGGLSHQGAHSCSCCERRRRGRRERPREYHTFGKSGAFTHALLDTREATQLRPLRQPTAGKQLQLRFALSHQTQTREESGFVEVVLTKIVLLQAHVVHMLSNSHLFIFLLLTNSTFSLLSSQPMPMFSLNLVPVRKARRVKTKLPIFKLPP